MAIDGRASKAPRFGTQAPCVDGRGLGVDGLARWCFFKSKEEAHSCLIQTGESFSSNWKNVFSACRTHGVWEKLLKKQWKSRLPAHVSGVFLKQNLGCSGVFRGVPRDSEAIIVTSLCEKPQETIEKSDPSPGVPPNEQPPFIILEAFRKLESIPV